MRASERGDGELSCAGIRKGSVEFRRARRGEDGRAERFARRALRVSVACAGARRRCEQHRAGRHRDGDQRHCRIARHQRDAGGRKQSAGRRDLGGALGDEPGHRVDVVEQHRLERGGSNRGEFAERQRADRRCGGRTKVAPEQLRGRAARDAGDDREPEAHAHRRQGDEDELHDGEAGVVAIEQHCRDRGDRERGNRRRGAGDHAGCDREGQRAACAENQTAPRCKTGDAAQWTSDGTTCWS